jgi:DNA helicase-2/ATP-dependent DNA helicase PcrA
MTNIFETRYQKLNPQQRQAVDTTEGPVMVIAGPGTGKTEILGARIARILEKQAGINPSNILCLTYTNAGVIAMRKRLLQFIGPAAHKAEIHTFHSFCNQIIQSHPERFHIRDQENISDLDRHEILEKILDTLPADHPLFDRRGYFYLPHLQNLFSTMKSENWTPEDIEKTTHEYIKNLPEREGFFYKRKYKTFAKGDPKPEKIEAEKEKCEKLLAGAQLFPEFQHRMQDRGAYDFHDMIAWTIQHFEKEPHFLADYQEKFQYILVDEFQDTNGLQKRLIDLLCNYWDDPNIFVVGDDDQSIYRFQGANLKNILDFYQQYKSSVQTITIDKNYRSSQKILDAAENMIEKNTERLTQKIPGLQKKLTAHNTQAAKIQKAPELWGCQNPLHEQWAIIQSLKKSQKNGEDLNNIAIIYQKHRQVQELIKLCESEKIPIQVKENTDIFSLSFFQHILDMLTWLEANKKNLGQRDDLWFRLAHSEFFRLDPQDMTSLMIGRQILRKNSDEKNIIESDKNKFLHHICINKDLLQACQTQNPEAIQKFHNFFLSLLTDLQAEPFLVFMGKFFARTEILETALKSPQKAIYLQGLRTLLDDIKQEVKKDPEFSLPKFLAKISRMKTHGLRWPMVRHTGGKEGVQLMTAHASKGLEFKKVFIMGVDKKEWDREGRPMGAFFYPDTLLLSNAGDFMEERRRLFFVAMTRAQEELVIAYSENDLNNKPLDPSIFISELSEDLPVIPKCFDDDIILKAETELLQSYGIKNSEDIFSKAMSSGVENLLDTILADYSLSPTHLNKYLQCPTQFYYENILKIPAVMPPAALFGTALHRVLELSFIQMKNTGNFPTISEAHQSFANIMQKYKGAFKKEEFEKLCKSGEKNVENLWKKCVPLWNREVLVEYRIKTEVDGIPISGKLDKIEFGLDNRIKVIDYKTGKPQYAKEKLKGPQEKNEGLGGDYWRQIVFYKILIDADPSKKWVWDGGIMDFIEPDKKGEFHPYEVPVSSEDEALVRSQIQETYKNIQDRKFEGGCGECVWCKAGM